MKVRRLIELLSDVDPNLDVVTDGYEDGVDIVEKISEIRISKNGRRSPWVGDYDIIPAGCKNIPQDTIKAVRIGSLDRMKP